MKNQGSLKIFYQVIFVIFFITLDLLNLTLHTAYAAAEEELSFRLKQNLQHDMNRRKSFTKDLEEKNKNIKERDKGLALFLEEQEKWDLQRDKGANEYRKTRKPTPTDKCLSTTENYVCEDSADYYADLAGKKRDTRLITEGRKQYIDAKKKIESQFNFDKETLPEEEELDIYSRRPRYVFRDRSRNKWVNGGKGSGTTSSAKSSGSSGNDNFDFPPPPPATDFSNIPVQDNFDDFPPPPPQLDGNPNGGFDSGFGDGPLPPPPAFPDNGFDF